MLRFILCDDDQKQLELMQSYSRQWGKGRGLELELATFPTATTLLEQYVPRNEDIVILDIIMPDMNGLELARRLRNANSEFSLIFLMIFQRIQVSNLIKFLMFLVNNQRIVVIHLK